MRVSADRTRRLHSLEPHKKAHPVLTTPGGRESPTKGNQVQSNALTPVPVPGTDRPIMATEHDGRPFVPLRPMCEALGIDVDSQRRKLDQAEWARTVLITVRDSAGRMQQAVALDADHVPMWLATIQVSRVAEAARPVLIAYQREAATALRDYFYRGVAVQPSTGSQFDILRSMVDNLEAAQRTADEAKSIASKTDARLDAIEGRHDWYSALGYARHTGYGNTSSEHLKKIGAQARQIASSQGIEPVKVPHALYGRVNSLPAWVWEIAFDGRAVA